MTESSFGSWREGFDPRSPLGIYGLLTLSAASFIVLWFLFYGVGVIAFLPFISTLLLIFFRSQSAMVVTVMTALFYLHRMERDVRQFLSFDVPNFWLIGVGVIVYLIAACRFLSLSVEIFPRAKATRRTIGERFYAMLMGPRMGERSRKSFVPEELWGLAFWVPFSLFFAAVILLATDFDLELTQKYGLEPRGFRPIAVGGFFFLVFFLIHSAMTYLEWKSYSPLQSLVFLRSEVVRWCGREQEEIARRAVRKRRGLFRRLMRRQ